MCIEYRTGYRCSEVRSQSAQSGVCVQLSRDIPIKPSIILIPFLACQTNVYPSAQRRKMRPFEGFQRKAVVIVPTEEEFKSRVEKREKEEGKEIPDEAVLEMKGRTHQEAPKKTAST